MLKYKKNIPVLIWRCAMNNIDKYKDIPELIRPDRYEPIANEIVEIIAEHHMEYFEVPALLKLVRAKTLAQQFYTWGKI